MASTRTFPASVAFAATGSWSPRQSNALELGAHRFTGLSFAACRTERCCAIVGQPARRRARTEVVAGIGPRRQTEHLHPESDGPASLMLPALIEHGAHAAIIRLPQDAEVALLSSAGLHQLRWLPDPRPASPSWSSTTTPAARPPHGPELELPDCAGGMASSRLSTQRAPSAADTLASSFARRHPLTEHDFVLHEAHAAAWMRVWIRGSRHLVHRDDQRRAAARGMHTASTVCGITPIVGRRRRMTISVQAAAPAALQPWP